MSCIKRQCFSLYLSFALSLSLSPVTLPVIFIHFRKCVSLNDDNKTPSRHPQSPRPFSHSPSPSFTLCFKGFTIWEGFLSWVGLLYQTLSCLVKVAAGLSAVRRGARGGCLMGSLTLGVVLLSHRNPFKQA